MGKYKAGQILTIHGHRYRITKQDITPCHFCECTQTCDYCFYSGGMNKEIIPDDCCLIKLVK